MTAYCLVLIVYIWSDTFYLTHFQSNIVYLAYLFVQQFTLNRALTNQHDDDDEESYLRPAILSLIGGLASVLISNFLTSLVYGSVAASIGPYTRHSNLYLSKYYLEV